MTAVTSPHSPVNDVLQAQIPDAVVGTRAPPPLLTTEGFTAPADLDGPTFEEEMKERARIRREKEDSQVAELRVKISRLEQALAAETKRRVEVARTIEQKSKVEIAEMQEKWMKQMEDERNRVNGRLEHLELRLEQMEERYRLDSKQQQDLVTRKGNQFFKALEELRKEADTERKLRLVREERLLQQIEIHGKHFDERWDLERQERIQAFSAITSQLDSNEQSRQEQQKSANRRLYDELQQLQGALEEEALQRQAQDDVIVAALNKYTTQFQNSLSILSGE